MNLWQVSMQFTIHEQLCKKLSCITLKVLKANDSVYLGQVLNFISQLIHFQVYVCNRKAFTCRAGRTLGKVIY